MFKQKAMKPKALKTCKMKTIQTTAALLLAIVSIICLYQFFQKANSDVFFVGMMSIIIAAILLPRK